jgi:hypothetical protein
MRPHSATEEFTIRLRAALPDVATWYTATAAQYITQTSYTDLFPGNSLPNPTTSHVEGKFTAKSIYHGGYFPIGVPLYPAAFEKFKLCIQALTLVYKFAIFVLPIFIFTNHGFH